MIGRFCGVLLLVGFFVGSGCVGEGLDVELIDQLVQVLVQLCQVVGGLCVLLGFVGDVVYCVGDLVYVVVDFFGYCGLFFGGVGDLCVYCVDGGDQLGDGIQ